MLARLRHNMLILCIGLALWVLIFAYLNQHPGEKASLIPSFQMMGEKVLSIRYRVTGQDPDLIEKKSTLIKSYDELFYLVEKAECKDAMMLIEISDARARVQNFSYDEINQYFFDYYQQAAVLKWRIDKECK